MTQFQTIVSGFIQHIEGISAEVEKEKLKVSKLIDSSLFVPVCGSLISLAERCSCSAKFGYYHNMSSFVHL